MGDYTGAEIDSAKMAAKWLGFIKSGNPELSQALRGGPLPGAGGGSEQREDIEDVENAVLEYLREGEDMPPELMQTSDIKVYAKAATRGLVAYEKSFTECNGKLEALRAWRKRATASEK